MAIELYPNIKYNIVLYYSRAYNKSQSHLTAALSFSNNKIKH